MFDPKVAGIENAELWEDISREYHEQGIGIEPKEKNQGMAYQEEERKTRRKMAVRGIRTLDTLPYTHFPGVLLQPLGHSPFF